MSWAPASTYRNGYYYVYFGNGANNIGVLRSTSPTGPFTDPLGQALITRSMPNCNVDWLFDPGVFIDDDGQAYLYFGGGGEGHARVIRLNEDMISVNGEAVTIDVPQFFEALYMHKRNGIYYLSYSSDFSESSARIDYMTSDNPMTGFVHRGTILDNPPDNCYNNNHASIFNIGDDWYVAYHTRRLANLNGITCSDSIYQRSAAINRMYYNPDGTIQKVVPNTAGVAQIKYVNPYAVNEAEAMEISSGIRTETCSEGGMNLGYIENGDWIKVTGVDFGSGASSFEARVASAGSGGNIEIRLGSPTGTLVGTCAVPVTGGWQAWQTVNCPVSGATGVQDLYLRFTGSTGYLFNFNQYRFYQAGDATPTPTPAVFNNLRDLADSKGFLLGACATNNPLRNETAYRNTLAGEFNWMGGENEFKAYLWSGPYSYNFTNTDYYRNFRDTNNMQMRGHVLVYYTVVPGWMSSGGYTNDEVRDMLRAYVQAMAGRYSGKMNEWDVVNEAVRDGSPYGYRTDDFWNQRLGDYIPLAFQWAREADPQAKLFYNDYGNEGLNGKSNYIYSMVSNLISQGVPIDGVGWQCHVSHNWRLNDDIWENAQRLTALGLQVSVTELDVAIPVPVDAAKLQSQAKAYADMTFLCMTHPNIKRMFLWGFTDKYSWIPGFTGGASDAALIFDTDYNKKPAYYAIETVLGLQPVNGIYNGGFESSIYCWNEMSGGTIAEETTLVHSGLKSARVYNRTQAYHGIGQHVLPYLLAQGQGVYNAGVWARLATGSDQARLTLFIKDDAGSRYLSLGSGAVNNSQWSEVSGSANVTWTGLLRVARLFVETQSSTSDFYVDDINFSRQVSGTPTFTATRTRTPTRTATPDPAWTATGTPTVSPTGTATPISFLLDDMEDGDNQNNWGGGWYSYAGGSSTVNPDPFVMTAGGMEGSANYRAAISGTINDYGGMGTNLDSSGDAVDLSGYTGVEFYARGNGGTYWFQFTQPSIADGDFYGRAFTAPADWTKVTILFSEIGQRGFGSAADFTQNAVAAIQWASNANGALDIQVDDVRLLMSSASPTFTRTATRTATPTYTGTRTGTPTFTRTRTGTPTFTRTSTPEPLTPTFTRTGTGTPTFTRTRTGTPTFTRTSTPEPLTPTFTSTRTGTATYTPSITQTWTPVDPGSTATFTATMTETSSVTAVPTSTSTAVPTFTLTPVVTASNTPEGTLTNTPVVTVTFTATETTAWSPSFTPTATGTATPSFTMTSTGTASPSATHTLTATRTATPTPTATGTAVPTFTRTATSTAVPTVYMSATPTSTLTPPAESEIFRITRAEHYPQPFNPRRDNRLYVDFAVSQRCERVVFSLYTAGYRRILESEIAGNIPAGNHRVFIEAAETGNLSNGTYYWMIEAGNKKGEKHRSRINTLIVLK